MTIVPTSPYPDRASSDASLEALSSLAAPLELLSKEVAELMKRHHLEKAKISLTGKTSGTILFTNDEQSGLTLSVEGSLTAGGKLPKGTAYLAHYSGEFFWKPNPSSPDFVHSGELVREGQLVGWAQGESKSMSFGLRADQSGTIFLAAPNGSKVIKGETVLYYIQGTTL